MGWIQLKDFDSEVDGLKMTVRVTKSDDSVTAKYSVAIGARNDPQPFRPFLRGDILSRIDKETKDTGATKLFELLLSAQAFIADDKVAHNAALKKAEQERIAALNGKRSGDPKANTGLSRFKTKYKLPEKTVSSDIDDQDSG